MKTMKMIWMLLSIGFVIGAALSWLDYAESETGSEEIVKCYDRDWNEIIGDECIDYNINVPRVPILITFFCLFAIVMLYYLLNMCGNFDKI